jgi:hypothetical protein
MSRDLATALSTELQASTLHPILLCEFLFDGGAIRLWNGLGDLEVPTGALLLEDESGFLTQEDGSLILLEDSTSVTYTGAGTLLNISEYKETSRMEAQGFTFTLSGIASSILSIALSEPYQGRKCNVYLAALDTATGVLLPSPYLLFSGLMDTMQISEGGDTCNVSISAENKMLILKRAKERRYTAESQKAKYPNDKGFDFVVSTSERKITWKAGAKK